VRENRTLGLTRRGLETGYNILAQPELRACYDALLQDPDAPALFPYGRFGSFRSRDGQTFFAARILAFRPEMRRRRFRAPLRRFDFQSKIAVYRDARRKLEVLVDQAAMPSSGTRHGISGNTCWGRR
jgi:hypothetical protein